MAAPVDLKKYQILVAPDSKKVQGLRTGDIVRRQYFDGTNIIYSLMCVLAYGTTKKFATEAQYDSDGLPILDANGKILTQDVERDVPYFIGALLEGDAPQTKELLDFARITNLFDADRSGALYLTASDSQAPFMDVIDGVGRNKSLCWPENIASEAFEDSRSQYIVRGKGLSAQYKSHDTDVNRIVRLTRNSLSSDFCGLSQDFYELVAAQKRVLISYKARANKSITVNAAITYSTGAVNDAEWPEEFTADWQYYFRAVNVINSGRHLRTFKLDVQNLGVNDWVEIADLNIILLDSISNFGDATSMRIGKLDGVADPVFGTLTGYGAYIQKLYASQTAHISGTLTAGDENGFASTFYAGKIHRNCFRNSCDVNFLSAITIDNSSLINPTGMGNVYKTEDVSELTMFAQNRDWLDNHLAKRYCFSFWAYAKKPCQIGIKQNGKVIGTIQIASDQTHEWRRLHVFFDLLKPDKELEDLLISITPSFSNSLYQSVAGSIDPDEQQLFITAPQLEPGEYCTQYQPTDDILDETDDYGAWFARGGIGGTIQNPLLRLNYDGTGAIDTRSNSFRLNQDGSGYLANENIKWDQQGKVTFGKDVTLNWDNLGDDAKDEMANRYMRIVGQDMFTIIGQEDSVTGKTCSPSSIVLELEEVGFQSTSSQRQWYLLIGDNWIAIPGANGPTLEVFPDSCYWLGYVSTPPQTDAQGNTITYHGESRVTFRCVIKLNDSRTYADTFNINKQYVQGYTVQVTSSKGTAFQNGVCSTVLTATVYYQGQPVNTKYALENFTFTWHRYKKDDPTKDLGFEDLDVTDGANILTLNYEMDGTDVFICELGFADHFDYSFPIIF
ncbi:hypothetical protein [Xylanibacter muris]|jgi:hypothetical protein|uniref:hypothetical protein n=1 Tax=Xylanibacter muris TaxID=2736290 RepID=UPI000FFED161|nr:hypothetical protein [Xylanibacter muris]RXE72196.1 hypothetical protein ED352_01715 [Muribaculaceae bacterium Isolate-002 (NCI)]